jgi:hypothetical protein
MIDKDVHELNAFFGQPKIGGANSPLPKYNKPTKMVAGIAQHEWPWPDAGDQFPKIGIWPYPTDRFPSFPKVIPPVLEPKIKFSKEQEEGIKKAIQDHIDHIDQEKAAKAKKAEELLNASVTPAFKKDEIVKSDTGKLDWSLVPIDAVEEIAKVLEFGAKKYAAHNWKQGGGFSWIRVFNSLVRHIFAWVRGEDKDPESGLSHLAHAGCNILFLLHYSNNKKKYDKDDRV